ncbi:MAG TPA: sugar transferase [Terriglobales bacterium]|nr:sugar transferase [Terriglobales bacterium]
MFSRRSRLVALTCVLNDAIATTLAFLLAYLIRVWVGQRGLLNLHGIYGLRTYLPILFAALILFPCWGYVLGAYRQVELRRPRDLATDVVKMTALGLLSLLTGLFLFKGEYVSRSFLLAFAVMQFLLLAGNRWLLLVGGTWFRTRPGRLRHFVIVGTSTGARELASLLEEGERFGLSLLAFVYTGDQQPSPPLGLRGTYSILPKERLSELLHNHIVDEVVFAVGKEDLLSLEPLMQQCEEEGVHMRVQLDFLPQGFSHVFVEHLSHVPLLTFASAPQNEFALFFKRVIDLVISAVTLTLLSPLFLILAVLIKLTSSGPVFYRQTRCGLGGRKFTLLKFRSMVADADLLLLHMGDLNEVDGPVFKMRNDPRCTTVGRWMRMFSLDELPQLWNVLRGDMSLVGPRPPLPHEVEQYEGWQRRRLRIRPGLTCLWALEGRSRLEFDRWVKLDLLYIDNWSMWLDFKILLKTIPAVLSGRGAH